MNVIDLEHGLVGCYGIVGGSIAAATGAALTRQARGPRRRRVLRRRRDQPGLLPRVPELRPGARLPVVFVCENNFYGEFTPMQQVTAGADIAARAAAYGMPARRRRRQRPVGGRTRRPRGRRPRPLAAAGPTLLECQTYRHYGHSKSDPATYRPKGELERWLRARPADHHARAAARGGRRPRRSSTRPSARSATSIDAGDRGGARRAVPRSRRRSAPRSSRHERRGPARVPHRDPRRARRGDRARPGRVVFFGEDVAAAGGVFKATPGLHERFGDERVFDTPISELALAGAAYGAAVTGLRPVFEVMFGDFMALPMDSLVNQSAKFWYISQRAGHGAARRALGGRRRRPLRRDPLADPRHLVPGRPRPEDRRSRPRPADAKGLLKAAIRDDNPVLFLEHKRLYSVKGPAARRRRGLPARPGAGSPARAPTSRSSRRPRACATRSPPPSSSPRRASTPRSSTCARCARSTSARCSSPSRRRTACSPSRRARAPAAGPPGCSARSPSRALHDLDDAWIVATDETPIPYSPSLEDAFIPDADTISASVRERLGVAAASG